MNVWQAKAAARDWTDANRQHWPGLVAAHLVGGITTMPADAPFPATKDVDMHLIFAEDSPALQPTGPFLNIIEAEHDGLLIEAGIKSVADYVTPEAILANPEIAHHLTVDSVLFDPDGLLRDVQGPVRAGYAQREWVCARVEYERRGFAGVFDMLPMARQMAGASGELNLMGYAITFLTAALSVALLEPPRIGGRMLVRLRDMVESLNRQDIHADTLAVLGLSTIDADQARRYLDEAAAAFDLAVTVRRSPHPFQHKLAPHLRPYFVDSCRAMIDEGDHREGMGWATPFYLSATDVVLADGPDEVKPEFAARRERLLAELNFVDAEERAGRLAQLHTLGERVFALADEIIAVRA